jgi:hypothetical protein
MWDLKKFQVAVCLGYRDGYLVNRGNEKTTWIILHYRRDLWHDILDMTAKLDHK